MKKLGIVGAVLAMGLMMSGCTVTPEQAAVIAQQAGTYSAVLWISLDNPSSTQMAEVETILDIIKVKSGGVQAGQSFTTIVYPDVVALITKSVPTQDQPLAKAAAMTILNGLDTLFAMHPEWQTTTSLTANIVNSYVTGASMGLGMKESNPVMKQIRKNSAAKAKMFIK